MSRMLKSKLPTVESLLKPSVVDNPQQKLQQRSDKQKMYYNRNAKLVPSIKEGEAARLRKERLGSLPLLQHNILPQDPT